MTNAAELLRDLQDRGIRVAVTPANTVKLRGPTDAITVEIQERVRAHKETIVELSKLQAQGLSLDDADAILCLRGLGADVWTNAYGELEKSYPKWPGVEPAVEHIVGEHYDGLCAYFQQRNLDQK